MNVSYPSSPFLRFISSETQKRGPLDEFRSPKHIGTAQNFPGHRVLRVELSLAWFLTWRETGQVHLLSKVVPLWRVFCSGAGLSVWGKMKVWDGMSVHTAEVWLSPFFSWITLVHLSVRNWDRSYPQSQAVVTHAFNLSTQEPEAAESLKFETSLVYEMSSMIARAT